MTNVKKRILTVEDEPQIRKLLRIIFEDENCQVEEAKDAKTALRSIVSGKFDLIILDLGLPDMDGKDLIDQIREICQVPIIVCSVRQADQEIIKSLTLGADDYLTKPFNPDLLVAKANAALRRNIVQANVSETIENGDISINLLTNRVFLGQKEINLTPKEHELLKYFLKNIDKIISHQEILKNVWGAANVDDVQYLRVYIKQLREKIEKTIEQPCYIINIPGFGYRMPKITNQQVQIKKGSSA